MQYPTDATPIRKRPGEPLVQAASRAAKEVRKRRRARIRKYKRSVLDRQEP